MSRELNSITTRARTLDLWPIYDYILFWEGVKDAARRNAFREAYERWSAREQSLYESGRLLATNVMAAGLAIPSYENPFSLLARNDLERRWHESKRKIGDAIPRINVKP
jgi:hypothetical protein